MKVSYENSFTYKVEKTIESFPENVILRKDLSSLGSPRQLTYAINSLIKMKRIARVSFGVYVKTEISPYFTDLLILKDIPGFSNMTREVLDKLNIPWEQSEAEEAYNTGKSTQIPVRSILRIKKRFRRKIAFKDMVFEFKKVA